MHDGFLIFIVVLCKELALDIYKHVYMLCKVVNKKAVRYLLPKIFDMFNQKHNLTDNLIVLKEVYKNQVNIFKYVIRRDNIVKLDDLKCYDNKKKFKTVFIGCGSNENFNIETMKMKLVNVVIEENINVNCIELILVNTPIRVNFGDGIRILNLRGMEFEKLDLKHAKIADLVLKNMKIGFLALPSLISKFVVLRSVVKKINVGNNYINKIVSDNILLSELKLTRLFSFINFHAKFKGFHDISSFLQVFKMDNIRNVKFDIINGIGLIYINNCYDIDINELNCCQIRITYSDINIGKIYVKSCRIYNGNSNIDFIESNYIYLYKFQGVIKKIFYDGDLEIINSKMPLEKVIKNN